MISSLKNSFCNAGYRAYEIGSKVCSQIKSHPRVAKAAFLTLGMGVLMYYKGLDRVLIIEGCKNKQSQNPDNGHLFEATSCIQYQRTVFSDMIYKISGLKIIPDSFASFFLPINLTRPNRRVDILLDVPNKWFPWISFDDKISIEFPGKVYLPEKNEVIEIINKHYLNKGMTPLFIRDLLG